MARHLIHADLAQVLSAPAGEFVSRVMNDVLVVREAIKRLANNLIRDLLTIITMVATMIWFDWLDHHRFGGLSDCHEADHHHWQTPAQAIVEFARRHGRYHRHDE